MSSKNRQQLKTGLRAILGGGLREEPATTDVPEALTPVEVPAPEPRKTLLVITEPVASPAAPAEEISNAREPERAPIEMEEAHEEPRPAVAAAEEPARKQRKKAAPPPPPEPKSKLSASVRVGTLENPYVRKRDNLPTRKVGIVLPVALAERMQIHCVKARTRPNEFVARAIEALLDELQA